MKLIACDIFYYCYTYFRGAMQSAILFVVGYIVYFFIGKHKIGQDILLRAILYSFFWAYLYIVVGITLLSREPDGQRIIKMLPFSTFRWNGYAMKYIIENILLFIPLGVFVRLIWDKRLTLKLMIRTALCSSILIEILQYVTRRGRVEIDDVMLNTLGAVIGWFLTQGLMGGIRFLCKKIVNKFI